MAAEDKENIQSLSPEVTATEIDEAILRGKIIYIEPDGTRREIDRMDRELAQKIRLNPVAISTITPNGCPNITPVSGVEVTDEGILISNVHMTQTVADLESMSQKGINHVTIAVWNDDRNGHKIRGRFTYSSSGEAMDAVRELPQNEGVSPKGAILLKPGLIIKCH